MWTESGPGTASHFKHSDCGLKALLKPTAATAKERINVAVKPSPALCLVSEAYFTLGNAPLENVRIEHFFNYFFFFFREKAVTLIDKIFQLQKFSSNQPTDIYWSTADVYLEQKLTNGFYINLSDRYLRAISSLSLHVNISIF